MKIIAILIMLVALFLLYRIACPRQTGTKKSGDTQPEKSKAVPDVMGKSRFVASGRSQPVQIPAALQGTEKQERKESIFAAGTAEKPVEVIPENELDGIFRDGSMNGFMSISLETGDGDETDYEAEEEAEELNRALGREAEYADGIDYDDLRTAAKAVSEQPAEVSKETAATLEKLENTDMFEWLVSGDGGKANWIKAVVERNIQRTMPETEQREDETSGNYDYGDFVADFLS